MKFKCVDTVLTEEKGFFNKKEVDTKHDGITEGNFYYGTIIPYGNLGGSYSTDIDWNEVKVIVTNDKQEWGIYPPELFIAVGD